MMTQPSTIAGIAFFIIDTPAYRLDNIVLMIKPAYNQHNQHNQHGILQQSTCITNIKSTQIPKKSTQNVENQHKTD